MVLCTYKRLTLGSYYVKFKWKEKLINEYIVRPYFWTIFIQLSFRISGTLWFSCNQLIEIEWTTFTQL